MRRHPPLDNQAVWSLAAYYTGTGWTHSRYRAARPEWITALVEANPNLVDDETYRAVFGEDRSDPGE
jgi:hypothetical protein